MFTQNQWQSIQERRYEHYLAVARAANRRHRQGGNASIEANQVFGEEVEQIKRIWKAVGREAETRQVVRLCLKTVVEVEQFLRLHVKPAEIIALFEPLLGLADPTEDADERMSLLKQLGEAHWHVGNSSRARGYYDEVLSLARSHDNTHYIGLVINRFAVMAYRASSYDEAIALCRQVIESRPAASPDLLAAAYTCSGVSYLALGLYDLAEAEIVRGCELYEAVSDYVGIANSYTIHGMLKRRTGDLRAARSLFMRSIELNRRLNNHKNVAETLLNLGLLAKDAQLYEEAIYYYQEAMAVFDELAYKLGQAKIANNIGMTYLAMQEYAEADRYFWEAIAIRQSMQDEASLLLTYSNLCHVKNLQREYGATLAIFEEVKPLAERLGLIRSVLRLFAHTINALFALEAERGKLLEPAGFTIQHGRLDPELPSLLEEVCKRLKAELRPSAYALHEAAGARLDVNDVLSKLSALAAETLGCCEH